MYLLYILLISCVRNDFNKTKDSQEHNFVDQFLPETTAWWIAGCDGVYCPNANYGEYNKISEQVNCRWDCATWKAEEHLMIDAYFYLNECWCWEADVIFAFPGNCN